MFDSSQIAEHLTNPSHQEIFAYWLSKRTAGRLPGREDVDPMEVPLILPWMGLVDVDRLGENFRFRYRLIGTGLVARLGRDSTGKWFDEIYDPELRERHAGDYVDVVRTAAPKLSRVQVPIEERSFLSYERLTLPLAADGTNVDMLLVVVAFDEA